jgi:hypothetical protein
MTTSAAVSGLAGGGGVLGPARMSIHGADDVVAELMRGYVAEQAAQSWVAHSHARVADIEPVDMNKLHLHGHCEHSSPRGLTARLGRRERAGCVGHRVLFAGSVRCSRSRDGSW